MSRVIEIPKENDVVTLYGKVASVWRKDESETQWVKVEGELTQGFPAIFWIVVEKTSREWWINASTEEKEIAVEFIVGLVREEDTPTEKKSPMCKWLLGEGEALEYICAGRSI